MLHAENAGGISPVDVLLEVPPETNLSFDGIRPGQGSGSGTAQMRMHVAPFHREQLPRLVPVRRSQPVTLDFKLQWHFGEPNKAALIERASSETKTTRELIGAMMHAHTTLLRRGLSPIDKGALRKLLGKSRAAYVDIDFPPTAASITGGGGGGGDAHDVRAAAAAARYTWLRPRRFLGSAEPHVFERGLEPADVQQGELGNCWFMCALAALAEFPPLVRGLFAHGWRDEHSRFARVRRGSSHDPTGLYQLNLNKHGQQRSVVVDDLVPCKPSSQGVTTPVFSRNKGAELWVVLVEKAYCKLHGAYFATRIGHCYEGLSDLTGAPTMSLDFATTLKV